jgi:hypothetical protein
MQYPASLSHCFLLARTTLVLLLHFSICFIKSVKMLVSNKAKYCNIRHGKAVKTFFKAHSICELNSTIHLVSFIFIFLFFHFHWIHRVKNNLSLSLSLSLCLSRCLSISHAHTLCQYQDFNSVSTSQVMPVVSHASLMLESAEHTKRKALFAGSAKIIKRINNVTKTILCPAFTAWRHSEAQSSFSISLCSPFLLVRSTFRERERERGACRLGSNFLLSNSAPFILSGRIRSSKNLPAYLFTWPNTFLEEVKKNRQSSFTFNILHPKLTVMNLWIIAPLDLFSSILLLRV